MSCSSCGQPECCGDPCSGAAPVGSVYETLSSALDNFILNFYGSITKTVVDGVVVWTLPCDLTGQIGSYIRDSALGTACYFKEILTDLDIRITESGLAISAAQSTAEAAQVAANLANAIIATYGDIVTQNKNAIDLTGGTIDGVAITNVPAPTVGGDAVNKTYADAIAGGLQPKAGVVVATTADINLASAPATIDSRTMNSSERVLVRDQLAPAENGIYVYNGAGSAMTRATDADTAGELALNQYYFVAAGSTYAGSGWFIFIAPTVINVDPVAFSQFSASATYTNGLGLLLTGNVFSINTAIVMQRANNLSDVASAATARTNLGLGSIAVLADTLFARVANNLSDLANVVTARTNLGLGSIATFADTAFAKVANNLSDLANAATARTNLGLGSVATFADTAFAKTANNLSDLASIVTARINLGLTSMATMSPASVALTGGTITGLTELKTNFGIFSGPVGFYDAVAGALYAGFSAGTAVLVSVVNNSGAYAPLSIYLGPNCVTIFDSTGIVMQPNYGIQLQGTGKAVQTAAPVYGQDLCNKTYVDSVAGGGGSRINVKDYGAAGDGATNDTTAINSAIAAMTNYSTLYFPSGTYLVTPGSITELASLSHIAVVGDGHSSVLYSSATGAPGNFLVVHSSCQYVTLRDFAIIGSATSRGSGIGLRMYASDSFVSNIYVKGTSDFAFLISNGAGGYTRRVVVSDCVADTTRGDGFHFGYVTDSGLYNCQAYYTYDDGLGIGDDGATGFPPARIEVVGFISIQAGNKAGGGTHGSGIRIFDGATDIHIVGGQIKESCEAGIQTTRATSTTLYSKRIHVHGLKVYSCLQEAGMYGNFSFAWAEQVSLTGCWSESPVSQCCYAFLDCNDLTVSGCTGKNAVVRTFVTDDGTTTNVAATWSNWSFNGNTSLGAPSDASYYFVPATGKAIANLLLSGNVCIGGSATNYIATNRLATAGKIVNNTSMTGKAITNGGSGISPTLANNN